MAKCRKCNDSIDDDISDSIKCDFCGSWLHADKRCCGMPKTVFNFFTRSQNIWICPDCSKPCSDLINSSPKDPAGTKPLWVDSELQKEISLNQRLLDENKQLNIHLNEKEVAILELTDHVTRLSNRIKQLEENPPPSGPNSGRVPVYRSSDWVKPRRTCRPTNVDDSGKEGICSPNRFAPLESVPTDDINSVNSNALKHKPRPSSKRVLPLRTKNSRTKHKLRLIGDSHARNCRGRVEERTSGFSVEAWVSPGANLKQVLSGGAVQAARELGKEDGLVIVGGVNGVSGGGCSELGVEIDRLAVGVKCRVIWMETPFRYDRPKENALIRSQNNLIRSKCEQYHWTFISINSILDRNCYTKHGLHLNDLGKDLMCDLLMNYVDCSHLVANASDEQKNLVDPGPSLMT
jgi:hypothetical protein